MKYGMLLWPHANARYQQAMKPLALHELWLLMKAAALEGEPVFEERNGIDFACFSAPGLTDAASDILRDHSQMYFIAEMRDDGSIFPCLSRKEAYLGSDLPAILKYKGKTNESFTHLLINLALYSSSFISESPDKIRLLDPMCGRATALFDAANRGFSSTGIDMDQTDISEAFSFFKRYLEYHKVKHIQKDFSMTCAAKRSVMRREFAFSKDAQAFKEKKTLSLSLIKGDASEAVSAFPKEHFHIVVADLPYGVQHAPGASGKLSSFERMLKDALAALYLRTMKGGAIALSYNTYTLKRELLFAMLEGAGYQVMTGEVYDGLEHWVEQAVMRDAIVGIKRA